MTWRTGNAKAAVFPVPVWATPNTSRPSRRGGIDNAWTGVGVVYPSAFTARRSSFDRPSAEECFDIPFNHINDNWGCYLGESKTNIDFILFGDSHSLSLKELVDDMGIKNNLSIFYTGSSGCIPFLGVHVNRNDQYENNCNLLNDRVAQFAKDSKIKGIILSSKWAFYTNGAYDSSSFQFISNSDQGPYSSEESINSFRNGLDLTDQKYFLIGQKKFLTSQKTVFDQLKKTFFFITFLSG